MNSNEILNVIRAGIQARQSLMLVGDPGKGKSAVVRMLADEMGYDLITIIGSQREQSDIAGFPRIKDVDINGSHEQIQSYAIPDWQYKIMTKKKVVLFLDEYSNSSPAVQAAMLALLNEREFSNGSKMPEETVILGAMNPVSSAANGFELSLPTCNRLMFIPWEPSDKEWMDGFISNWGHPEKISPPELEWRKRIVAFLIENSDLVYKLPAKHAKTKPVGIADNETSKLDIARKAYPTNRSWTNLAKVIPFCRNENGKMSMRYIEAAAFGIVGNEATNRFIQFIKERYSKNANSNAIMPKPDEILRNPSSVNWKDVNAVQARQVIGNIMHMNEQDRAITSDVIKLFVHIAENRGTDICAPYVQQLLNYASAARLRDEMKPLMQAYKSVFA